MQGNWLLFIAAALPIFAAPLSYALGRKDKKHAVGVMVLASAVTLGLLISCVAAAATGRETAFRWDGFCGLGLAMRADGFRALYAMIAGVMWLCTSIFSFDYFDHEHNVGRYAFFTLLTLGATVGVLLSDSLYSTFLFFEVMSLASYPWVAHEENPEAMRAAETYLYIAIIGGLCMLMGLLTLPGSLATARFDQLSQLAAQCDASSLWLPAVMLLIGFGAKAGAFPLHVWLPKAHPVAPAPSSALLSGMLTKSGVFGMLVLTCKLMPLVPGWGTLIFWLGVITMFLGALLALFSVNLKRTLACSSLSQIGFIMIGVGLCGLLGSENGLASWGTVQHMVNHSAFKLLLFLCAGVVAMNAHALSLDDVRGFGRKKPLLHIAFLSGLLGIGGVPGFSGYISKSLLHEGILEYVAELQHLQESALAYQIAEWVFLISGGMTLAYMLKLYLCLFWSKHPTRQAEFDGMKKYVSPESACVLAFCAALPPLLGLLPDVLMTGIGRLSQGFLQSEGAAHVVYFSGENLIGACKSLAIGAALYLLVVRLWLTRKDGTYPNRWPAWLDLENSVYRPLLAGLSQVGYGVSWVLDHLMDWLTVALNVCGTTVARLLDKPLDAAVCAARETILRPAAPQTPAPVGNRFTCAMGRLFNGVTWLINHTFRRAHPITTDFVTAFAAGAEEMTRQTRRLTRSISFSLLMFCLGLFTTLIYLVLN
ncbi:MAG: complex I subunit 5 family protein [Eubacteriales bacterium]|nr:complex I subunit 5 family protein [Eubacteriales bacterium]